MADLSKLKPVEQFEALASMLQEHAKLNDNLELAQDVIAKMYEQEDWQSLKAYYSSQENGKFRLLPAHLMKGAECPDSVYPPRILMNQVGRIYLNIDKYGQHVSPLIEAIAILYGYKTIDDAIAAHPPTMNNVYPVTPRDQTLYEAQFGTPHLSKIVMGRNHTGSTLITGNRITGKTSLWLGTLLKDPHDDRTVFVFSEEAVLVANTFPIGHCDITRLNDYVISGFWSFDSAYRVHIIDTKLDDPTRLHEVAGQVACSLIKEQPHSLFIFDDEAFVRSANHSSDTAGLFRSSIATLVQHGAHVVVVGRSITGMSKELFGTFEHHIMLEGTLDEYDWETNPLMLNETLIHDVIAFAETLNGQSCTYFVMSSEYPEGRLVRAAIRPEFDAESTSLSCSA